METAWQIGLRAAKANLRPGLVVQALMIGLIISYYSSGVVRSALDFLGTIKSQQGLLVVLLSSAFAGAIFPTLLKVLLLQRGKWTHSNTTDLGFLIPYWMFMGWTVDLLYRAQGAWFGDVQDFPTVALKVAVDQILFTPFFSCPITIILFELRKRHWDFAELGSILKLRYLFHRVTPLVLAAWAVWIPLVSIVYAMPNPLQFPVFSLILSFWSLMLAMIATDNRA